MSKSLDLSESIISVVVPCYREAGSLAELYNELRVALGDQYKWELILVDDGSPDDTLAVATALSQADKRVRTIGLSRNFGKESAMIAGLEASIGQAVVIMDGDLQHPPSLIPQLLAKMEETGADQVLAKRNRKGDPFFRSLLSKLYYRLVNSMIDVHLADGVGDFRLMSRRVVNAVLKLRESNRFSKGIFQWVGFSQVEVTYDNVVRERGESSWTTAKLLNYAIESVLSFNNRPLRIAIYLGGIVLFVGIVYFGFLLVAWALYGIKVPGYITTMAAIIAFGGVQLLGIGVIGEYVGRIYMEVKERPHYLISTDLNNPKSTV